MSAVEPLNTNVRISLVDQIHDSPLAIVIATTGGGVASVSDLLLVPGASRTVLEALIPYSFESLSGFIGRSPDQAVSQEVAESMALACLARAEELVQGSIPVAGGSCTAALVTDRRRRGDNRAHISIATREGVVSVNLSLEKGLNDRATEDRIVSDNILLAISEAAQVAE